MASPSRNDTMEYPLSRRLLIGIVIIGVLLTGRPFGVAQVSAAEGRCFTETGKCIGGPFLTYWEANGGLAQQGLPLTDEFSEVSPTDGKPYTVQYFERARFEHHPENKAPYDVLLGLLGSEQYALRYASTQATAAALGGECRTFAATGKQVCGPFLTYWDQHGGLAQQGQPLTPTFWELNPTDGKKYQVQYFERARFEHHPENKAPYDVLLGLLGREQYRARYATALGSGAWAQVVDTDGTTGLRLRKAPAPWETLLAVLPEDSLLQIIAGPQQGGNGNPWFNVLAAGQSGWVDSTYLQLTGSLAATPPTPEPIPTPTTPKLTAGSWAQVSGTSGTPGLNLRAAPSASERQLAVIVEGTKVNLLEGPAKGADGDPWYRIGWKDSWGWVNGTYLVPTDAPTTTSATVSPSPAPTGGTARGAAIVQAAMAQVGKPYIWGGTGPVGFDCSGLTLYAARKALGVTLPRTAAEQFAAGVAVAPDALQPGDLVFYANTYTVGISHVGIYIGGGRWVSALDESIGIKVVSLDEPYWKQRYAGARRIS
jgi:cell wall-associated NlpC family hydrolase